MKLGKIFFIYLSATLILMAGCKSQNKIAVSSGSLSAGDASPTESFSCATSENSQVPSMDHDWTAYIDADHNLCVKKQGNSDAAVIVENVMQAPCVVGEWVYYLANLDEIDKVRIDGSQITKVCDTDVFQVYNANADVYHEINGSTSITAEHKDGFILYTCVQLGEVDDEKENPPSCYKLDLEQGALTAVEN